MQSRIVGTTLPVLEFTLEPNESVVSEAGELSWMSSSIQMQTHTQFGGGGGIFGALKRVAGGGSLFMTEYRAMGARGEIAFATRVPGHIQPVQVGPGHGVPDPSPWFSLRHAPGSARGRLPAIAGGRGVRRRRIPAAEGDWAGRVLDRVVRRADGEGSGGGRDVARPSGPRGSVSVQRFFSDHPDSGDQEHDFWRRRDISRRADRPGTGLAANPPHLEIGSPADAVHAFGHQRANRRWSGRRDRGLAAERVRRSSHVLRLDRQACGPLANEIRSIPSHYFERKLRHLQRDLGHPYISNAA